MSAFRTTFVVLACVALTLTTVSAQSAPAPAPVRAPASAPSTGAAPSTAVTPNGGFTNPWDLLKSLPQFSLLVTAATLDSGLLTGLQNPATAVTIFAPTNTAITDFIAQNNITASQLLNLTDLPRVLEYHVVPFAIASSDFYNTRTLQTLLGTTAIWALTTDVEYTSTGKPIINVRGLQSEAMVIQPDMYGGKSIVHGIDNLLIPPTETSTGAVAPAALPSTVA